MSCGFTNNHDVMNNCMIAHDIRLHVLESFSFKEGHNVFDTLLDVEQSVYVSKCLSHKSSLGLLQHQRQRQDEEFLLLQGQPYAQDTLLIHDAYGQKKTGQ